MKKRMIEGRCYKKRTAKGVFRMKKKSLEELRMERYFRTLAYIASEDDDETRLMIEATKELLKETEEAMRLVTGEEEIGTTNAIIKERDEAMTTAASSI